MPSAPQELEMLQNWMQAVISHPGGVVAGVQSEKAQATLNVGIDSVENIVTRSENQTSVERLGVYGDAYFARLIDVMAGEYPAIVHALGEEAFNSLAFTYLQAYPSTSYTLGDLSKRFPQYLEETRPPAEDESLRPDWADFLIDLATIERTYAEVFDGPGVEGKELLKPEDLQTISVDNWPNTKLECACCLRLVQLRFPAYAYATAVRRGQSPEFPAAEPSFVVVKRKDFIVRRDPVAKDEFKLLESLMHGETVGDAIAIVAESTTTDLDSFAANLQNWFFEWSEAGYFTGIISE